MFNLMPVDLMYSFQLDQGMIMSISIFGYILLAGVILLAAYLVSVSSIEPPLEHYRPPADKVKHLPDARS